MSRVKAGLVPLTSAGIGTMKCECGWETTIVLPEEAMILFDKVLNHIQQHGIEIPKIVLNQF